MNSFWIFHRQTAHSPRIAAAARVSCPVPTRFALARGLGPLWPLHQALRCKYWIVACAAGPNSPLLALPGLIAYALHEHLRTTCPDSCCHTLRYLVQLPCLRVYDDWQPTPPRDAAPEQSTRSAVPGPNGHPPTSRSAVINSKH
jgi:hypothetical protein